MPARPNGTMLTAPAALERLREGNRRFAADRRAGGSCGRWRRRDLVAGQTPFAAFLGCSDSRVPAEIVFDQGLGDLFVVRVAGNVAGPTQVASIEFAAERFGTRLVVVLGHSSCGAVAATIERLLRPAEEEALDPGPIVGRIAPVVRPLLETKVADDRTALLREAVRANIRASIAQLRDGSPALRGLSETDGLQIVGAEYSLETGLVQFYDPSGSHSGTPEEVALGGPPPGSR